MIDILRISKLHSNYLAIFGFCNNYSKHIRELNILTNLSKKIYIREYNEDNILRYFDSDEIIFISIVVVVVSDIYCG